MVFCGRVSIRRTAVARLVRPAAECPTVRTVIIVYYDYMGGTTDRPFTAQFLFSVNSLVEPDRQVYVPRAPYRRIVRIE